MKRRYSLPLQPNGQPAKDEFVALRKTQAIVSNGVIIFKIAAQRDSQNQAHLALCFV